MTMDLEPVNPIEPYHSGSFSWGWMVERGVLLPLGCHAPAPGSARVFYEERDGRCPVYNDGFVVTEIEARAIAWCAYGVALVERGKWAFWENLPPEERARREAQTLPLLRRDPDDWMPIRKDFIERVEEFAWFAHASGGFRIY